MPETLLTCKSCKNKVPLSDLKADKSGSGWVCMACYKHQHPEIYKEVRKEQPRKELQTTPHLVKYYCSECGYKFKKEPPFKGKCPYCDLYSIKEEKDADSLLRDSIQDLGIDSLDKTPISPKPEKKSDFKIEIIDD